MRPSARMLLISALLLVPTPSLVAQSAGDPSGHWEGTIQAPDTELTIEIDLARTSNSAFAGTFGQPAQGVKGLPLSLVTVQDRSIRFVVKGGEAPATFVGVISGDGKSMSGEVEQSGFSIPFTLTRTGEARIARVPKSAAIGKELEGTWHGTLDLGAKQMRIVLTMANQPDGTATGTVVSPDGSGVEIPFSIVQKGSSVTIGVASVGAAYVGALNAGGTEMVGTWTQQSLVLPVTFRRAEK